MTVFVSGRFNVLHPGHIRLLRFAKEYGGRLLVAVESDRLAGIDAHVPEHLRLEGVKCNSWVDDVFIMDEPVEQALSRLKPDIVVKGKEHEQKFNSEAVVVAAYGGKLLFSSGEAIFSSHDLICKEFLETDSRTIGLPQDYLTRHQIDKYKLADLVNQFSELKVCVIGDMIVDEYITCQPLGMSQEDPTIVVTPLDSTRFIGGAGIVAAHAAAMGANVKFISVTGVDDAGNYAKNALAEANVDAHLLLDDSRPTTLKQRFRSKGRSLLKVSHLHQSAISKDYQTQLLNVVESALEKANLLVFSDFNYGCLPQPLIDEVIKKAKSFNVLLAADSQSSSQVGDISRFRGMDLLTPTEREARISTRDHEDGLVILAEKLRNQSNAKNILLKLGEEGLLIHADSNSQENWLTDRIKALNSLPKDVAGAGDSLLITSGMAMVSGANIWESALLGSLAAAVQVGRVGNTPIKSRDLLKELN